jgi:diguanylate cyclase (GGDEF)-like protein
MNIKSLRQATGPLGLALIALACWLAAGLLSDRMVLQELDAAIRTQRQISSSVVDNMAAVIGSDVSMSRAIPATIAQIAQIRDALASSQRDPDGDAAGRRARLLTQPALAAADRFLHDAQASSGLDAIWLVDADGLCVAADLPQLPGTVGTDMHVRRFLSGALGNVVAEVYEVGHVSGEPGIYLAAPVHENGATVGAVVAKVGIVRLRHWVARAGTFVTDANGVVIMAYDSALEGSALPGARVLQMSAAEQLRVYRRTRFPLVPLENGMQELREEAPWMPTALAGQLYASEAARPRPALYESRSVPDTGLTAHLLDPLVAWPELQRNHRRDRLLVFLTLAGTAALAWVVTTSYVRERRHHQATRDLAEQLQRANARLSAEARHDALTGALSRRYFLDQLRREIMHAQAGGNPLCVAIADLDHFKQINDRFGHPAGDRALVHFVETCRDGLRVHDAIGRLGGEEFGILLPNTTLEAGREVVERLRSRLRTTPSERLPAAVSLSVSIGITGLSRYDQPERIMSRADLALYAAKSGGRDRIEVLPPDDSVPAARTTATTWRVRTADDARRP